jgi:hypothetical protein
MTISSNSRKAGPFIGNGTAATFPFTFKVFQASDLEVVKLTVSTNVETILVLNTDFTAVVNEDQNSNPGGTITLVAGALAAGFNLVITSDIENLQPTDLTNQGGFYPEVITDALDRATIQIQQLQEGLDRAALLPITSSADAASLVVDIVRLADSADNLDIDANNIASINSVAGSISNVNTVATNISNVNTVAGVSSNVTTVATNVASVNTVAADLNEPVSEIETVATNITNVNTVGTNIANVNTVASDLNEPVSEIDTVATNIANVNTVGNNIAAITTVANDLNEPTSEIDTVATNIANVNAVGSDIANVNIVAVNIVDVNNFSDVYQGAKATPPTLRNNGGALQEGDMYFNTTSDTMFVYGGSGWVPAGSSVNGTSQRYKYVATAGQTSFSGLDANGNTLTYDAGFIDVYLNGVHLDPTDYTATTGTSIVLASGAALNDELYIVAFGTFSVASFNGSGIDNNTINISKLNATGTRSAATALRGDNTFADITPTEISDQANTSTGYMMMPVGTTAQRPGAPATGMYRMNTTTEEPEWYDINTSSWIRFSGGSYSIEYLAVAGGGGGGYNHGGGGGAGGYIASLSIVVGGQSISIVVGAAGSAGTSTIGGNGGNSTILASTAIGGGGGGSRTGVGYAATGGSGGGGAGTAPQITPAAGTSGQGNSGGTGTDNGTAGNGGGGGGANAVGGDATGAQNTGTSGAGGNGKQWLNGSYYAGGGSGGRWSSGTVGAGGLGGGGVGGNADGVIGGNGTANTGGGGGGGGGGNANGGSGGSGVVIIRYAGAQRGTGGTVTSVGGYTIHTFTSSGTFTA